ncbi:MAG: HEAT repeat domain-containing protein [Planctomycetota bacterium]
MTRAFLVVLLIAATALPEPGRNIRYTESTDRLVYAFVFGHKDTCRVIRRTGPPPFKRGAAPRRRMGIEWKGLPGEKLLGEFSFGRRGRPLHVAVSNDGAFVVAFANRASALPPEEDSVWIVAKSKSSQLQYDEVLAGFPEPAWPVHPRALAEPKPAPKVTETLSYAFLTREVAPGRILVARQSEDGSGGISEMTSFVVVAGAAEAKLPERAELIGLLGEEEPLFRAGAARHLGRARDKKAVPALKRALQRTEQPAARVALAAALVRCGDNSARKTLRVLLAPEHGASRAAAYALASLPPDSRDADALGQALERLDERGALFASIALARLGGPGTRVIGKTVRSRKPETRVAAAVILGRMHDRRAEQLLLRMVGDTDESVRKAAAKSLTNPPRKILEQNYKDFAQALRAAGRTETKSAAHRLATLAMHAKIKDEAVLEALVELTTFHPRAAEALRRLTGLKLETSDDWKRWWAERKKSRKKNR